MSFGIYCFQFSDEETATHTDKVTGLTYIVHVCRNPSLSEYRLTPKSMPLDLVSEGKVMFKSQFLRQPWWLLRNYSFLRDINTLHWPFLTSLLPPCSLQLCCHSYTVSIFLCVAFMMFMLNGIAKSIAFAGLLV